VTIDSDSLIKAARRARASSYSPYSQFAVGAAVLAEDGTVYHGSNVENASYGLAMCAERVAIFKAVSSGARKLSVIAVSCPSSSRNDVASQMPCGACLQVMAEFGSADMQVLVDGVGHFRLSELLSRPFKLMSKVEAA